MRKPSLSVSLMLLLSASIGLCQDEGNRVRVASISYEPVKFDLDGNAKTLEGWFRKAAGGGAKIAVAPEGALDGYVVNEIISAEADEARMHGVAVSIDSPTIKRLSRFGSRVEYLPRVWLRRKDRRRRFQLRRVRRQQRSDQR